MIIERIDNSKQYISFLKEIYSNDKNFINNKSGLINLLCNKNTHFYKNSKQSMICVKKDNEILCQAVLIRHKNYQNRLMIAFFEAKKNELDAVKKLIDYAKQEARKHSCNKIEVAVDGHCNYSVGFLASHYNDKPSFGQSYNPSYYNDYFKELGFNEIDFVSFISKISEMDKSMLKFTRKKLEDGLEFEYADFSSKNFKNTIERYSSINNKIFTDHRYYYNREIEEDIELFKSMKPLLRNHNLIFAKKDGKDIGFLLWYPELNEFVSTQKEAGVSTFIKYQLLRKQPKKVKLVEIGVLPTYQKSGLIILLFSHLYKLVKSKYPKADTVISSWILDENFKSKSISRRFLKNEYKRLKSYEMEV